MTQRQINGEIGEKIVLAHLTKLGWDVQNSNNIKTNHPNFDLVAEKNGRLIRIQVKSKEHKTKASLAGSWYPDKPTFNKSADFEKADYVVMVRFTPNNPEDYDCFVLTIAEATKEVNWFAQELISRGKSTKHIYPYVNLDPRNSIEYPFNTGAHWAKYCGRWKVLETGDTDYRTLPQYSKEEVDAVKEDTVIEPIKHDNCSPITLNAPLQNVVVFLSNGVNPEQPGLYVFVIEGVGNYVGKYTHASRYKKEYARNVEKLLTNKDYRPKDPKGFRHIHHVLAKAVKMDDQKISLILIENCHDKVLQNMRERELINAIGSLNGRRNETCI